MKESEWLTSTEANKMLHFLFDQPGMVRRKASRRKLRLFGCGCCRRIWDQLTDPRSRYAVEVAERLADGKTSAVEVEEARRAASKAYEETWDWRLNNSREWKKLDDRGRDPSVAAQAAMTVLNSQAGNFAWADLSWATYEPNTPKRRAYLKRQRWQAAALRCIFGNPFRPPPSLPRAILRWNDGTVRRIAEGVYKEHAFDRLPILAGALLDAGCDNEELLAHLRSEGPHVRGCWALDVLLGKG
jgi:hypothetical protein